MYMVPGQSAAVLQVKGLKPLTPDQAYEFWFIRGKDPQPSNVFTVNPDGSFTLLVQANDTVEKFNAWGVSIEPRSGVSKPTGPIVMLGGG
jgi:anti-sigma-K factor RskA